MKSSEKSPAAPTGLASALFTPVQQRVLTLLFVQTQRRFQSAELIRLADSGNGSVQRLLSRLEAAGLLTTQRIGNQKHYQANADSPIFAELAELAELTALVRNTVGLVEPLRTVLAALSEKISAAFVFGSAVNATDHADSDIDLMVIADGLDYGGLYSKLPLATRSAPDPWAAHAASQRVVSVVQGYGC